MSTSDVPPAGPRPIPLLGEIPLDAVELLRHELDARFAAVGVLGLDGEVQQRAGRGGHRIHLRGVLHGASAADELATLQAAAEAGDELHFAADITTALDLRAVVITDLRAETVAGRPGRISYELWLVESPPLPPPAELDGFGGLGDLGFGELGFDTDLLGELGELAGQVMAAASDAFDVLDALSALSNLDGLSLDGVLAPLDDVTAQVTSAGRVFRGAVDALGQVLGS
jgi:hypothetical protein